MKTKMIEKYKGEKDIPIDPSTDNTLPKKIPVIPKKKKKMF